MMLIKRVAVFYLVTLHFVLAGIVLWPEFASQVKRVVFGPPIDGQVSAREMLTTVHQRMDGNVPVGSVVFLGDSMIQQLPVNAVASPAVNYGISGDTASGVLDRLGLYSHSLTNARAVVLCVGVNDLNKGASTAVVAERIGAILDKLPAVPVLVQAVFPVDECALPKGSVLSNAKIKELNQALAALCRGQRFLENPALPKLFHLGDGVHLNTAGAAAWIEQLRSELWRQTGDKTAESP